MSPLLRLVIVGTLVFGSNVVLPGLASAQNPGRPNEELDAKFKRIQWQYGPCKVMMRNIGQAQVPNGYKFTGEAGTAIFMELTQNLPSPMYLGTLCPNENNWFLVFDWNDDGYVKDDDKKLDANAILESLREGQEQANQALRGKGLPEITLVGWQQPPFYDPQTNLLTWGTKLRRSGMEDINYNSRILGRGGVMSVNLVIAPELLHQELPKYKEIVRATSFQPGQTYAEWRTGDKVASYGLAALVTGGAAVGLAKSGWLAKLGKFIIAIAIGTAAVIGGIFKKFFGRRTTA